MWITTDGQKHKLICQIRTSTSHIYTKFNIKYVLLYDDSTYGILSLWILLCNINTIFKISWLVLAFFRTSNYLEACACMLKINYERMVVAKRYLNHELVHIWPINSVNMVLQQMCAHSLKLIYITPTPKILPCLKLQKTCLRLSFCECNTHKTLFLLL